MANTVVEPIELPTFISQIDDLMQSTAGEKHGLVAANQPRQPDRWDEMISRLLGLRSLREDWDGMGAKAPPATRIDGAVELARILRQHGFRPPSRVGAGPDGEVLLEWQDHHVYLEAEVCVPRTAEWMLAIDGQPPKHWVTRC